MSGRSGASSAASLAPPIWGMTTSVIIKSMTPLYALRQGQRFGAILCFQNDITAQAEKFPRGLPDRFFIFRQQQSFAASRAALHRQR